MRILILSLVSVLFVACGGSEAPTEATEEPAAEEAAEPAPEPAAEPEAEAEAEADAAEATQYHCSMHPEVVSDKPGTCSECGMDLVAVEEAEAEAEAEAAAPMKTGPAKGNKATRKAARKVAEGAH